MSKTFKHHPEALREAKERVVTYRLIVGAPRNDRRKQALYAHPKHRAPFGASYDNS